MKKFLIQSILLILVIGAGLYMFKAGESNQISLPFLSQSPKQANLVINNALLRVEVADSPSRRSKGLADREKLASDEGMLFVFEKTDRYNFWMKGLKFPLDFVWIKGDSVVDFLENVPSPAIGQDDKSLPIYSPKLEVNKVLEVNSGTIQRLNIKVGDKVQIQ